MERDRPVGTAGRSLYRELATYGVPLLAGLLLRVIALRGYITDNPFARHLFSDSHHYYQWARAIASGNAPAEPFFQTPFYPYLLGLLFRIFGESLNVVYIVQLLAGLTSVLLVVAIGRIFLPRVAAAGAGLAFALLPYPVFFEQKLLPEPVGLPIILGAVLLLVRPGRTAARTAWAGGLVGLASLARANLLLFGAAMILLLLRRGGWRRAVLFAATFLVVLLPVVIRNAGAGGGAPLIAANGGEVFFHGNNENARGTMGRVEELGADIDRLGARARQVASRRVGRPLNDAEASRYWFGQGLRWIAANPLDYARLEFRKARLAVTGRFVPISSFFEFEGDRFRGVPRFLRYLYYPVLFLALSALVRRKVRRTIPPEILVLGAVQVLTLLLFFVCSRYRIPLDVVLCLAAAAGVSAGLRGGIRASVVPLLLVGALIVADGRAGRRLPTPFAQLASIRSTEGRGVEAIELYGEALRIAPGDLRHHQNLAREWERQGDAAKAVDVLSRARRAGLSDGRTIGYEGALLRRLGRWDEGEVVLREAVALEPSRARTRLELGALLEETNRFKEAVAEYEEAIRLDPGGSDDARRGLVRLFTGPLDDPDRARKEAAALLQ